MGQVKLIEQPFQEIQEDTQGINRKVWVFPIQLLTKNVVLPQNIVQIRQEQEMKEARGLNYEELKDRATKVISISNKRFTKTKTYQRNEYVAELAKRRAQGICELCEQHAPFKDK